MKKIVLFLAIILLASCTKNNIIIVPAMKEVKLNTVTLISAVETPILNAKTTTSPATDFPAYTHPIPDKFTVYFVYDGSYIKFENITEGNHTFKVPARSYKVVVTNYNIDNNVFVGRSGLPQYSEQLYLYGESTIDYSTTDNGSVTVTNDYAAVMLLKEGIKDAPKPTLNNTHFGQVPDYYNLYTRLRSGNNIQFTDFTGKQYNFTRSFDANKVYRFKVGKENGLNIIVQDDILITTIDESL